MKIIAHRGMGQAFVDPESPPENTLPSFDAAWRAGVVACELDVMLAADAQVVVFHDRTTERTTDAQWVVAERTTAELRTLDAGRWKHERWAGTPVPLLSEVLASMPEGRELYVELKDGPQIVPSIVDVVRASKATPQHVIFKSFDIDTIAAMKAALPAFTSFLLVAFQGDDTQGRWNVIYDEGRDFRAVVQPYDERALVALVRRHSLDGVDASFFMPPSLPRLMREEGLQFVTWTVNDPRVARDLIALGVTAITTDVPVELHAALGI